MEPRNPFDRARDPFAWRAWQSGYSAGVAGLSLWSMQPGYAARMTSRKAWDQGYAAGQRFALERVRRAGEQPPLPGFSP